MEEIMYKYLNKLSQYSKYEIEILEYGLKVVFLILYLYSLLYYYLSFFITYYSGLFL